MAYRANVTDKEQGDVERANDDSAIRFAHFDSLNVGEMKAIRAFDLQPNEDGGGSPTDMVEQRDKSQIGSHNDNAHRFDNPGKA